MWDSSPEHVREKKSRNSRENTVAKGISSQRVPQPYHARAKDVALLKVARSM